MQRSFNGLACGFVSLALLLALPWPGMADMTIDLGSAGNFAVLAGSTVTNTGPSAIMGGNVGVSPDTTITGFPPGTVAAPYTTEPGNTVAAQAQTDLTTAYNKAAGLTPTQTLNVADLGGLTLTPGVYSFSNSSFSNPAISLTGTLTLNDQGNPNAQFVFQIGTTLTTASNASVVTTNGGSMPGCTVFWQVGTSATLGADTAFEGHILADTSITLDSGATILDGSVLARNGAVSLNTNSITNCVSSVPEPSSMSLALLSSALLGLTTLGKWWRERHSRAESQQEAGVAA